MHLFTQVLSDIKQFNLIPLVVQCLCLSAESRNLQEPLCFLSASAEHPWGQFFSLFLGKRGNRRHQR